MSTIKKRVEDELIFYAIYQLNPQGNLKTIYIMANSPQKNIDKCLNIVYTIYGGLFMKTVVKKWGNSLGIRIPNHIARELSLKDGSFVDINDNGKAVIIEPIKRNKLSEMISKINEQNIHKEIKTGKPVGKEIW